MSLKVAVPKHFAQNNSNEGLYVTECFSANFMKFFKTTFSLNTFGLLIPLKSVLPVPLLLVASQKLIHSRILTF